MKRKFLFEGYQPTGNSALPGPNDLPKAARSAIVRPRMGGDSEDGQTYGYDVYEPDPSRESEVLDQNGNPYIVTRKRRRIGFRLR